MILETHNKFGEPQRIECTRLLVRCPNGTPAMVAMQMTDEQIWCAHSGESGFQRALETMGISETVIVHIVDGDQVPVPSGQLIQPRGL